MRFPHVSGENLAGERFDLPGDLALPALVVVAYRRDQQPTVDTWLELADDLAGRGVATYEVPVIPRYDPFSRRFVDAGMRAGVPDPAARERTITVYTDVGAFRRALELDGGVAAVLVDADGEVVWVTRGRRYGRTADAVAGALDAGAAA